MPAVHIRPLADPACAMRCGTVPFLIAPAGAQDHTVFHIDRDDHALTFHCADRTFSQDRRIRITEIHIVVNTGKRIFRLPLHSAYDTVNDCLTVDLCKLLHHFQIVQIVFHQSSGDTGHFIGCIAALFFHLHLFLSGVQIIFRHFHPQMPAAGMHDQIDISVFIPIQLDEMITASQGPYAAHCLACIDVLIAAQPAQIDAVCILMRILADLRPHRYLFPDHGIQLLKLQSLCFYSCQCHTTADINAYQARQDTVSDSHGQSDRCHFSRMHIRHHADLAARRARVIADHLDLRTRMFLQCILLILHRIHLRVGIFSVNRYHK